ncbi:hypothetical protein [Vibrio parahaemolyticus]|uniref:hypothetical protein n=1 Tax=Vibrio parahaemolyticus TaxID=670 RepID=UPI00214B494D|nr:hypothetical protein [Vibrio parahaemolyticus]
MTEMVNLPVQLTDEEEQELQAFETQHRIKRQKEEAITLRVQGYDVMRRARLPLYFSRSYSRDASRRYISNGVDSSYL